MSEDSKNRVLFKTDDDLLRRIRREISEAYIEEIASGSADGSNKRFNTSYEFYPSGVEVYVNGIKKLSTEFDIIAQNGIVFRTAPAVNSVVAIKYIPYG